MIELNFLGRQCLHYVVILKKRNKVIIMRILKKLIAKLLIGLLTFSIIPPTTTLGSIYSNPGIEKRNDFNFVEFLKKIDQYVEDYEGQLFISDTDEVKSLISSYYNKLNQIDLFSGRTETEIFNEIAGRIYGFDKDNAENIDRATANYYWTTYWWGIGYKFFSKSQALQYANDLDYVRIYPGSASAAIIVMGSASAAAYLLTLSNDVKANASYLDSFALDLSWVLIYTIYAI